MKIDKDALIKHRFWVSIPVAVLFIFIALLCVLGVRSTTRANWDVAERTDKQLNDLINNPEKRNPKWIQAMKDKMDEAVRQKNELWVQLYDRQNDIVRERPAAKPASADNAAAPVPAPA